MNSLRDVLGDLRDTDAIIDRLKKSATGRTVDPVVKANLNAVTKRRRDLERRLGHLLRESQFDHISYQIERPGRMYCPARGVTRSIELFQDLFTAVYDAVCNGLRATTRPSADIIEQSLLQFAAPFVGAAVSSLVIANDRLLAISSDLDKALELVFEILTANTSARIRQLAREVGVSAMALAHAWADNSVDFSIDVTIVWRKSADAATSVAVTLADASRLRNIIQQTVEERSAELDMECELVSLDDIASTFRLLSVDGQHVEGHLADSFPRDRKWVLRATYLGELSSVTRVRYATGETSTRWLLRMLTKIG